jgi:hypothetical protein
MEQQKLVDLFIDYFYLDTHNLSHTYSLDDKIIDKSSTLLARFKDRELMIYSLYSSDQISIPIEYINIFLGFLREEGDRLKTIKPKEKIEGFIVSLCSLVKSLFYGIELDDEAIKGLLKNRSGDFRELMRKKFNLDLPFITIENIGGKARC